MNWLDRAIGVVAPGAGLRRARQRQAMGILARAYEGARLGRRTEGWVAAGTGANAEIAPAIARLRDRSRDLVRNNPYAAKAVTALVSNMIGTGLLPRARAATPELAAAADRLWSVFSGAADADGLTDFAGLQALIVRSLVESGEVLVRLRERRVEDRLPVPLQLQVLEADHLDSGKTDELRDGGFILSALLLETVGWRGTCLAYAGLHLTVVLPLSWFALPREGRRFAQVDSLVDRRIAAPSPVAFGPLMFGLLAVILTTAGAITALWSVHLIAILQAGGVTLAAAVGLGALVGPAQVGARVVEMAAGGHHHPIWTLVAAALLIATGLLLLWAGWALPAVALIAYGAGNGIWSIARGTLPLALFGTEGYAVLMGRLAMPSLIAQAMAPSIGALLMQRFGSQTTLGFLTVLAVTNVLGVLALWLLWRRSAAAPST